MENLKVKLVEATPLVAEGQHKGEIVDMTARDVEHKGKTIRYLDIYFSCDGMKREDGTLFTLIYGVPLSDVVTPKSQLGKFLQTMGCELGNDISLSHLLGKRVSYLTINNDRGFTDIVKISPIQSK